MPPPGEAADGEDSSGGTDSSSDSDRATSSAGSNHENGSDAAGSSESEDSDGAPAAFDFDIDQADRIMQMLDDDDGDVVWAGDEAGMGGAAAPTGNFTIDQVLDTVFATQYWLPGVIAAACTPVLVVFGMLLVLLSLMISRVFADVAPASPAVADLAALQRGTGVGHLACPAQAPVALGNGTGLGSDEWLSLAWKGARDIRGVATELQPGIWGSFGAVGATQALMLPADEAAGQALIGLFLVAGFLTVAFTLFSVPCLLVRQARAGLCGRPEALASTADLAVRLASAKGASSTPAGASFAQAQLAATEAASSLARSNEGRLGQAARLASPGSCGIEASFDPEEYSCSWLSNSVILTVDPCARSCSGAVALYLVLPIAAGAMAACAALAEGSALSGLAVTVSPAPLLPGANGGLTWSPLEPLTAALSSALDLPRSPELLVSPMADVVWGAWTSEWWLLATRLLLLGTGVLAIAEDVASATTSVLVMPSCLTTVLTPRAPPATTTSEMGFNASTTCRTVIADLFARFAWACLVTAALLGPSGAVLLDPTPERAASVPTAFMAEPPSVATLSIQLPPSWCSPPTELAGTSGRLNSSSSSPISSCALSYSWPQAPTGGDVLGLADLSASPLHFAATALGRGRPSLAFGWPGVDTAPGATVSGVTLGANASHPANSRPTAAEAGHLLTTEPGRRLSATALSLVDAGAVELPRGTWTWSVPVRSKEVTADPKRCNSTLTGACAPPPPSLQLSGLRKAPRRTASGHVVQSPAWAAFHRTSAADVAVHEFAGGLSRSAVQALVDRCGATMVSSTPNGVPALELASGTSAAAALSGAGSSCGAPEVGREDGLQWDASPERVLVKLLSLSGLGSNTSRTAQVSAGVAAMSDGLNVVTLTDSLPPGAHDVYNASAAAHEFAGAGEEEPQHQQPPQVRIWLHAPTATLPIPLSSWWPLTRRAVVKQGASGASIIGAVPASTDSATAYLVPEPCTGNCTAPLATGSTGGSQARPATIRLVLGPLLPRLLFGRRWGLVVDVPAAAMWWQALSQRESAVGDALLCAALLGLVFDATRTALWMVTSRLVSAAALCFPIALRGLIVMQDSLVVVSRRRRGKKPGVEPIARIHVWESLRHSPALARLSGRPALASTGGLAVALEQPRLGEPRLLAASSQFFADSSLVAQHIAALDGTAADVNTPPATAPLAGRGGAPAWRQPWAVPAPLSALPGLSRRASRLGSKLSAEATAAGVDWALGRASLPTDQGPTRGMWQASLDGRPLTFIVGHDQKHERDADDMFSSDDSSSDSSGRDDEDDDAAEAVSGAGGPRTPSRQAGQARPESARASVKRHWRGAGALWAVARAVRLSVGHEQPIRQGFEHRREWRAAVSRARQTLMAADLARRDAARPVADAGAGAAPSASASGAGGHGRRAVCKETSDSAAASPPAQVSRLATPAPMVCGCRTAVLCRRTQDAVKTQRELDTCRGVVRAASCAARGGDASERQARVLATWLRVASIVWEASPLAVTALLVADLALAVAVALVWAGMWAGACLWAEAPHLEAMLPHGPVVVIVGLLAVCMFLEKFYLAVVTGATIVGSYLLLKGKALVSPLVAAVGSALTSCAVEEHFAMHVGALPMHRGTRTGATMERVRGWCAVTLVGLPALVMTMGSASLVLLNAFEAPYLASSVWAPPALVPNMPGASYYASISSSTPNQGLSMPGARAELALAAPFGPSPVFALASLPTSTTNATVASNPAMQGPRPAPTLRGHLSAFFCFMAEAAAVLRIGSLHWAVASLAAGIIAMPILERLPGVARSLWVVMDLMTLHSWPTEPKDYLKAVAGAIATGVIAVGLSVLPSLFRRASYYAMLVALGTGSSTWHLLLPRWALDGMARWLGASLDPFTGAATGHWAAAAAAGWGDHGGVVFPWWPAPAVVESAVFAAVSALLAAECGCSAISWFCCPQRQRLRIRSRQPQA